jgi:hypothetical protein
MNVKALLLASCVALGLSATTWAQNSDLVDILTPANTDLNAATVITALNGQQSTYQLKQATSCEQLKSVFVEWAKNMPQYPIMYAEDAAISNTSADLVAAPSKESSMGRGMDM